MKYFTIEIKKEKSEYVKIVARDIVTAINWALKHCETEEQLEEYLKNIK